MANFIGLIDPDVDRRKRFIRVIEPKLPLVDGLIGGQINAEDCCVVWAANESAPIDSVADDKGLSVILGEAIQQGTGLHLDAKKIRAHFAHVKEKTPEACDGFHVSLVYESSRGIVIGTDPLGLFPVYYYATDQVLLVGSSPELFRYHPVFKLELNPAGLVGILLTNGLVDGQTLFRGVSRLSSRSILCWQKQTEAKEIAQFEWPLSMRHYDLPFSAHIDLIHDTLNTLIRRYASNTQRVGLLLSGGRDSRMLGGYLKQNNADVIALTLGQATDIDRQCARRVAECLGFEHNCTDVDYADYARCAKMSVQWEHLTSGLNNITDWVAYGKFRGTAPRFALGALCDAIIGGSNIVPAYSKETGKLSFDQLFKSINKRGIPLNILQSLLRQEVFGDLKNETLARCQELYNGYSEHEAQRGFCFSLEHHERFHVGSMAWACSFSAWPVLPFCDLALLNVACGMPAASLAERRLQDSILCSYFKKLASLPLDHNNYETTPLLLETGPLLQLCLQSLLNRFGLSTGRKSTRVKKEQRYHYRIWDLNNPGWFSVRREVEKYREYASAYFNRNVFDKVLPPPDQPFTYDSVVWEASGPKLLLGFLIWAKKNL